MSRKSTYFGFLEKPSRPRPSREQMADELAAWQAQGGRIKQLPTGKAGQDKGKAK